MGQYAVAMVTLNRAGHDSDKVCATVFAPKQFSWANGRIHKVKGGFELPPELWPRDQYAWWKANRIALMSLNGRMVDFTAGSNFYHALRVHPVWRLAMERTRSIGQHIFYRDVKYVIADLQRGKQ